MTKLHLRGRPLFVGFLIAAVAGLGYLGHYVVFRTAVPIHFLDQLGLLHSLYLPPITCDNCSLFPSNFLVHNGTECKPEEEVFLIILVISHHADVTMRRAIRTTWGRLTSYKGQRIKTIFMFGVSSDKNLNWQLTVEQAKYRDIVQADFEDTYQKLTEKTMAALQWIRIYCPQARYVLKTDDDSFNYPHGFVDYLKDRNPDERFVGGYCLTVMPDQRKSSKYYIPRNMYPKDKHFPVYCAGPGYVLSQNAVRDIVYVSPNVRYLPLEDVFVGGLCRTVAGIGYTQIPGTVISKENFEICDLVSGSKNAHKVLPTEMTSLWHNVMLVESRGQGCWTRADKLRVFVPTLFCLVCLVAGVYIYNKKQRQTRRIVERVT